MTNPSPQDVERMIERLRERIIRNRGHRGPGMDFKPDPLCAEAADMLAALSAILLDEEGWQPIETAPLEGSAGTVLVWGSIFALYDYSGRLEADPSNWEAPEVWMASYIWRDADGQFRTLVHAGFASGEEASCKPTHWRPLPQPPRLSLEGGDDGQ